MKRPRASARAAGLEPLWAPWRMSWIRRAGSPAAAPARCLFCRVAGSHADRRDLVLARRANALLMLNRYPYATAHLMVAVSRHAAQFHELTADEGTDVLELTAVAERALATAYAPHGLNYGINFGRVAGAGFPGHLHLHLVPRWDGDTNFMPAIAHTRVLPESLTDTWSRLRRSITAHVQHTQRARPGPARKGAKRGTSRR